MYHPDELRDEHGRWSASGLLKHGIKLRSAGRVNGRPAQAVYHNGARIGHVESHGNGRFSAHLPGVGGPQMKHDRFHSGDHESISAAAAHIAADHLNRQIEQGLHRKPGAGPGERPRSKAEALRGARADRRAAQAGRGAGLSASGLPKRERATGPGRRVDKPAERGQAYHKAARHHIGAAQNFLDNAMTSAEGQPIVGGGWEPGRPEQVPGELRGAVSHIQRARSALPTQHPAHPHLRAAENHASTAINMRNPVGYIGAAQRSLNNAEHHVKGADQPRP